MRQLLPIARGVAHRFLIGARGKDNTVNGTRATQTVRMNCFAFIPSSSPDSTVSQSFSVGANLVDVAREFVLTPKRIFAGIGP